MLAFSFSDVCKICRFCSLLLRRECCTFSNGEYVKAGLAELELWCCQAKDEVRTLISQVFRSMHNCFLHLYALLESHLIGLTIKERIIVPLD